MNTFARAARLLLLALLSLSFTLPAHAQPFPSKPIKMIVPFGSGSGVDIVARIVGEGLSVQLKQPVVTENYEGAAGNIGAQVALRQPADGYTILAIPSTFLITPQLLRSNTFDPVKDFTALAKVAYVPFVLVTSSQSQFKSMKELIAYMKENPDKVSYATSGKGAQSHLEVEFINRTLGLKAIDVPYKASSGSIADTMSNQVSFYMTGYGSLASNIHGGKLRALAVGSSTRIPVLPDVPTFMEATGIQNYVPTSWFGFVVKAGTPADVRAKLEEAITRAVSTPTVRDKILATGNFVSLANAREFNAEMLAETEKWGKLINALHLKSD